MPGFFFFWAREEVAPQKGPSSLAADILGFSCQPVKWEWNFFPWGRMPHRVYQTILRCSALLRWGTLTMAF